MDFLVFIGILMVSTAVVAFAMAFFVRSTAVCILGAAAITFLGIELLILYAEPNSPHPEEIVLGFTIVATFGLPVIILSAVGFVPLAEWLWHGRHIRAVETKG